MCILRLADKCTIGHYWSKAVNELVDMCSLGLVATTDAMSVVSHCLRQSDYYLYYDMISLSRLLSTSLGQSLGGTVQSVSVVTTELSVNSLQGWVLVGLWLLNTVLVGLSGLVVGGVVLRLGHLLLVGVPEDGR